jgi:uncharacterized protein with PQ loop repeat
VHIVAILSLIVGTVGSVNSLFEDSVKLCNIPPELPGPTASIGIILAWVSSTFYFFSRVPQIITNYRLREVEGLSILLFILTISGNLFYGFGILLRFPPIDLKFYQSTLPYLIGSIGTLLFDIMIVYQAIIYSKSDSNGILARLKRAFFRYELVSE